METHGNFGICRILAKSLCIFEILIGFHGGKSDTLPCGCHCKYQWSSTKRRGSHLYYSTCCENSQRNFQASGIHPGTTSGLRHQYSYKILFGTCVRLYNHHKTKSCKCHNLCPDFDKSDFNTSMTSQQLLCSPFLLPKNIPANSSISFFMMDHDFLK